MINDLVRLSNLDPLHPGQTGVVTSHDDHYVVVALDNPGPFGDRTTVHENSVTPIQPAGGAA